MISDAGDRFDRFAYAKYDHVPACDVQMVHCTRSVHVLEVGDLKRYKEICKLTLHDLHDCQGLHPPLSDMFFSRSHTLKTYQELGFSFPWVDPGQQCCAAMGCPRKPRELCPRAEAISKEIRFLMEHDGTDGVWTNFDVLNRASLQMIVCRQCRRTYVQNIALNAQGHGVLTSSCIHWKSKLDDV